MSHPATHLENMPADIPSQQTLFNAELWQQKTNLNLTGDYCRQCQSIVLRGEDVHGITRRLDAYPLDPTGELTAVLTSRLTYRLWQPERHVLIATRRWAADITSHPADPTQPPAHLRSGPHGSPALAIATHHCGIPLSTHQLQLPALAAATDFPTEPTY